MATFLARDERFLALEDAGADPESAGVYVLPAPFERTSSFGTGSCHGPAAILRASHEVEFFDCELGFEPCEAAKGIATRAPLAVDAAAGGAAMADQLDRAVAACLARGKKVVTLTGEHTGVVGAIRAHARHFDDLTVVQLDAHSDTRETYLDDPWSHACAMARVLDFHPHIVQVGIRSEAREERERVDALGLSVFRCATLKEEDRQGSDWVTPIIDACSANVYVTFDCDVLDPSIMPATGTPEPGGMTWEQVNALLSRLCEARNVVGFDVNELSPIEGIHHPEFTAAKLIYRFIGYLYR